MLITCLLSVILYAAPKPQDQFKIISVKTCTQRVLEMEQACDVTNSVQQCHDSIETYYMYCGNNK